MDDLSLDVVGRDVPLTGQALGAPANKKPVNLDLSLRHGAGLRRLADGRAGPRRPSSWPVK